MFRFFYCYWCSYFCHVHLWVPVKRHTVHRRIVRIDFHSLVLMTAQSYIRSNWKRSHKNSTTHQNGWRKSWEFSISIRLWALVYDIWELSCFICSLWMRRFSMCPYAFREMRRFERLIRNKISIIKRKLLSRASFSRASMFLFWFTNNG